MKVQFTHPPFDPVHVPAAMTEVPRWVNWRYEDRGGPKPTKVPLRSATDGYAKSTDPRTWGPFAVAVGRLRDDRRVHGVGFVLGDGWVGTDLDGCGLELTGDAKGICDWLESYTERSPSGQGVHVICRGRLPGPGRKRADKEMYDAGRYFTVTGARLPQYPAAVEERSEEVERLYHELFPAPVPVQPDADLVPRWRPAADADDADLIARIRRSRQGGKFWALWSGQWQPYYGSQSEADLALASILNWWCGGDAERVDALFRQSGLFRGKWDAKRGEASYGRRTLRKAVGDVQ